MFLHICLIGAFNISPLLAAWLIDNAPDAGKRGMIIGLNESSNLSGVIARRLFKSKYAPSYHYPLTVTMALICVWLVGFLGVWGVAYVYESQGSGDFDEEVDGGGFRERKDQ